MLHNFHIKMTAPNRGEVLMDGNKIKGVKAIEFHASVASFAALARGGRGARGPA